MSLECYERKRIVCDRCGHSWFTQSENYRVLCSACGKHVRTGYPTPWEIKKGKKRPEVLDNKIIQDDIMRGNIFEAMNKADMEILNNKQLSRDIIPIVLQRDDIKFAFAKACEERKKSPVAMVRMMVGNWLKKEGYL